MNETVEMKDFLFGKIYSQSGNTSMSLHNFRDAINMLYSPAAVNSQINRLLKTTSTQHIEAQASSSSFDLNEMLLNIPVKIIAASVITRRDDRNTNVDYTLSLLLYFDNGIIEIGSDWCTYKHTRAFEAFDYFLVPIILHGHIFKSVVDFRYDGVSRIEKINANYHSNIVHMILSLGGHKNLYVEDEEFMASVSERIEDALNVAQNSEIAREDKHAEWRKLQRERLDKHNQ